MDAEITILLKAWSAGDSAALEQLSTQVYEELRRMARRHMKGERRENTLQTTALVHEVYLRMVDVTKVEWQQRAQFFAIAAQMMRRILVDAARRRAASRHGGGLGRINFDDVAGLNIGTSHDRVLIALNDALEELSKIDPRKAKMVELRYFGGLSVNETAAVLKVSEETITRDWRLARGWLLLQIKGPKSGS